MPTPQARTTLERWLRAHRCADAREQEHRARMLELLAADGDPFARDRFAPGHFTASAFVLSPRGDQLLLIHHRKLGRWLQPGGHIEASDADLLAAARREVAEETGIADLVPAGDAIFDLDVHDIPPLDGEAAHAHFDVRFLLRAGTGELDHGAEVAAARFVPLHDLRAAGDAFDSDASVMRAVRKLTP